MSNTAQRGTRALVLGAAILGVAIGGTTGVTLASHTGPCCSNDYDHYEGDGQSNTRYLQGANDDAFGYGDGDTFGGGHGEDAIRGNAGADDIDGGDGHDVKSFVGLIGNEGNDSLQGDLGGDILDDSSPDGGDSDVLRGSEGGDILNSEDGDGNDAIYCGDGGDFYDKDPADQKNNCDGDTHLE